MSQIIEKFQEKSGRWCVRAVVDATESLFAWFGYEPSQQDVDDHVAQIIARRAADIVQKEIDANIASVMLSGSLAAYTLDNSTAAQNFAALREAYRSATQTQAVMVGDFLSSLTNNQLQNAFGMTAGQVTTLRDNKLTPAATAAATIRAAAGA